MTEASIGHRYRAQVSKVRQWLSERFYRDQCFRIRGSSQRDRLVHGGVTEASSTHGRRGIMEQREVHGSDSLQLN